MSDPNVILEGQCLHKTLGRGPGASHVLRGLDISVRAGEFLAVMGSSGCGKSTLLHVLGLMTPPDEGVVRMDGCDVVTSAAARTRLRRTHVGFIFQRFNLLGMLTAIDNIRISLKVRGLPDRARAVEWLDLLGVGHVAGRKPAQMSIGEQQRVAVARALAHRPRLLLADEPTGNLDSENTDAMLDMLTQINRDDGQTIVMITHSPGAAARAQRIATMTDGRIRDTA